jgi:hypothetical protein
MEVGLLSLELRSNKLTLHGGRTARCTMLEHPCLESIDMRLNTTTKLGLLRVRFFCTNCFCVVALTCVSETSITRPMTTACCVNLKSMSISGLQPVHLLKVLYFSTPSCLFRWCSCVDGPHLPTFPDCHVLCSEVMSTSRRRMQHSHTMSSQHACVFVV